MKTAIWIAATFLTAIAIIYAAPTHAATILFPTGGGTGSSTLSGILLGNGTGIVRTTTIGTGLTLSGTTLGFTSNNISQFTNNSGYLTAIVADSPLSGSGTSASHLTLSTSGTWAGNAGTATALAGNGTNCTSQAATGVDASGNAEGCFSVLSTDPNWSYFTAALGNYIAPTSTSVGIGAFASSTIGDGTRTGGLTISGGATTSGMAVFSSSVGIGGQPTAGTALKVTGSINVTAQTIGANQSATAPSFTFNSSASTGFFFASGAGIGISTFGQEVARFSNSSFGLGTSSPYALLSIAATSTTGVGSPTTLFVIASTTGGTATSTLFSVDNTGAASTTKLFGSMLTACTGTNALTWSAGAFGCQAQPQGTVTSVTATYPLSSSGGATPNITTAFGTTTNNGMTAGFLYSGSAGIWQTAASSSLFGFTPLNPTRTINTTYPLQGGGDLSADRTLTSAFGTTSTWGIANNSFIYTNNSGVPVAAASSSFFGYTPLNPTRALTINGTAQQITSSAGSQDLSADRTWTLSLPTHVKVTEFEASLGSTTNATSTNLSVTSSSTLATLFGAGLSTCGDTSHGLGWSNGSFSCQSITGAASAFAFTPATNYNVNFNSTTTPIWLKNPVSGTISFAASSTAAFDQINVGSSTSSTMATSTFFGNISVSGNASSTGLAISGTRSALLLTNAAGIVSGYGGASACSNQFVTALSATGGTTCASINNAQWSGTQLSVANGGTNASSLTGNRLLYTNNAGDTVLTVATSSPSFTISFASSTAATISGELNAPHSATVPTLFGGDFYINSNGTASSSIAFSDGTNTHNLFAVHSVSSTLASSTLAYMGAFGAAGTTTILISNPLHKTTIQSIYCRTDVGTAWLGFGTGSATTTEIQCSTSGATATVSSNNSFTGRQNLFMELGRSASSPNSITVTADVEDTN